MKSYLCLWFFKLFNYSYEFENIKKTLKNIFYRSYEVMKSWNNIIIKTANQTLLVTNSAIYNCNVGVATRLPCLCSSGRHYKTVFSSWSGWCKRGCRWISIPVSRSSLNVMYTKPCTSGLSCCAIFQRITIFIIVISLY